MKTFLATILLFHTAAVFANWQIKTTTDAMSDETSSTIYVKAHNGEKFTLIRKTDNSVWGYFNLTGMKQFKINDQLLLRVDKNKPREINDKLQKAFKVHTYEWNPNLMGFLLWHGSAKEDNSCGFIGELINGKKLVIRYHPNKSTKRDVVFDISKNKNSIKKSLSLPKSACR